MLMVVQTSGSHLWHMIGGLPMSREDAGMMLEVDDRIHHSYTHITLSKSMPVTL
jgi:hypothetical protein